MGRIGKVGRELVKKLDYQAETCFIITINDTSFVPLAINSAGLFDVLYFCQLHPYQWSCQIRWVWNFFFASKCNFRQLDLSVSPSQWK
jgi:hypothetical protein